MAAVLGEKSREEMLAATVQRSVKSVIILLQRLASAAAAAASTGFIKFLY